MLKLLILLSAVASALSAAVPDGMLPQLDGRIVGGTPASISVYPWQISLQRNGFHFCGGSIYSATIVVTAAHCLQRATASSLQVRAGTSYWRQGGHSVKVADFRIHEAYNPDTMVNDIAVIRLASSLTFSSSIKPIGLATTTPADGAAAVVTGWGDLTFGSQLGSDQLQSVNVNIISNSRCTSKEFAYSNDVKSTMLCAGAKNKDSCQGDSGGPLVSGGVLVGVVSWGWGCAFPQYPGVYADVAALRPWVVRTANTI